MRKFSPFKTLVGSSLLVLIAFGVFLIINTRDSTAQISLETLKKAEDATAQVSTYRFTMDFRQTPQIEGDANYQTFTEATVVFGEGMHIITRVGEDDYYEFLLLDGIEYVRGGPNAVWESVASSFDPDAIPLLDPDKHFELVSDLTNARILGEEQVNGILSTKVQGSVNLQSKAEKIWGNPETQSAEFNAASAEPRAQFLAGSEEFTGWVGKDDGLFHAFDINGTFPAHGELQQFEYSQRVELFDFDEPLVLPTP